MASRYTLTRIGPCTVIEFTVDTLMDPIELEQMANEFYRLVEVEDHRLIIMDFERVQYLSSQAIGMVLGMMKKIRAVRNGKFMLCSVGPKLLELIRIIGIEKVLTIKPTQLEAVNAMSTQVI